MNNCQPGRAGKPVDGFRFDVARRSWSLSRQNTAGLRNAGCTLTVDGRAWSLADADTLRPAAAFPATGAFGQQDVWEAQASFRRAGFSWTLRFERDRQAGAVRLRLDIQNDSAHPLTLGNCDLIRIAAAQGGVLNVGPDRDQQTFCRFFDGLGAQYVKRVAAPELDNRSDPLCHLFSPATGVTFFAGFITFDRCPTLHTIDFEPKRGIARYIAGCDFREFQLQPGCRQRTETIWVTLAHDPYAVLEQWADAVQAVYHPVISQKPPVGWVGWSWVDGFHTELPEKLANRNSAAIRRRLAGFEVDYVWISISNLKDGLPGNWLTFDRRYYPGGFERTLKRLQARRFKPGLWVGPFYMAMGARDWAANRNNLLKRRDGSLAERGTWMWAIRAREDRRPVLNVLDGGHPRTAAYLKRVFTAYRKLGIRYYMIDFLGAGLPRKDEVSANAALIRGPEIYRRALAAVRQAARWDTHLLSSSGPTVRNIGIVSAARIGADYGEGRQLLPRFASYPATYMINGSRGSSGTPHHNALQNLAATYFTHRRFYLNDLNLLTVDKPISRNDAEISVTLFGMSGSPVMLGDDIDTMDAARLALIKKVLPRTADTARPADLFQRVHPGDYARVLYVPVAAGWDHWTVLAVFNLDPCPARIAVALRDLQLDPQAPCRAYDFWNERYEGIIRESLAVEVPAGACRLLRLSRVRPHPWILATDMHIRQGQVELARVRWNARTLTLSGTAARPRGETGNLLIVAPDGFKPADYRGLFVAKDARDEALIIRKPLAFGRRPVAWQIRFQKLTRQERARRAAK